MQKKSGQRQEKLQDTGKKNPVNMKVPQNKVADEIRGAFMEQQSKIVNEINKSINAEHVGEKNES